MIGNKQVILIRGGESFETNDDFLNNLKTCEVSIKWFPKKTDWKSTLDEDLGEGFEVLLPQMPNKENARYVEWKIWFERMLPFLSDEVILIGSSLGGTFLAKYLAENTFPKIISQLHLIAPAHNDTVKVADFTIPENLENITKQVGKIYIYHSVDDPIVPVTDFEKFQISLPTAKSVVLNGYGHVSVKQFPELIENITKEEND